MQTTTPRISPSIVLLCSLHPPLVPSVLLHQEILTLHIPVLMRVHVTFSPVGRLSAADDVKFCRLIGIIINDRLYYGMKAVRRDKVRAVIYGTKTKRG